MHKYIYVYISPSNLKAKDDDVAESDSYSLSLSEFARLCKFPAAAAAAAATSSLRVGPSAWQATWLNTEPRGSLFCSDPSSLPFLFCCQSKVFSPRIRCISFNHPRGPLFVPLFHSIIRHSNPQISFLSLSSSLAQFINCFVFIPTLWLWESDAPASISLCSDYLRASLSVYWAGEKRERERDCERGCIHACVQCISTRGEHQQLARYYHLIIFRVVC